MRGIAMVLVAASLILATGLAVQAAEEASPGKFTTYDLGDLVVSAEKPGPGQVAISQEITEQEIEATNSKTAAQALSHAPGVVVSTNRKNEPTVQIYGLAQEKALILIDGVPYYETKYRRLNLDQIPADIIAKIEVIKGAPSVLYGANDLAGVVNIITKKAGDKPAFLATAEVSEHDTYRFSLSQGMKVDKVNYWVNYTHRESAGWRLSDDFQAHRGTIVNKPGKTVPAMLEDGGDRENSDYNIDTVWARLGYQPTDKSEYFVNLSWLNAERGMPTNVTSEQVFTTRPNFSTLSRWGKYNDLGLDLSGRQKVGEKLTLKGKLFYHDHQDDYVSYADTNFQRQLAVSTYQDYFLGGNLVADYELAEGHAVSAALHYKGDSHKERDDVYLPYADSFSHTGSLGGEYRFTGLPGLTAVTGVSYDWNQIDQAQTNVTNSAGNLVGQKDLETPDLKSEFNPMAGASYNLDAATRVFASIARKTRFPTLFELYTSKGGNIKLEAEKTVNYTVGVERSLGKQASVSLSGFYMDISDWISRDGPYTTNLYRNYAQVRIAGGELGGRWTPLKDLTLRLDYTYAQARDESDGAVTDHVIGVPEHKLDLGASYLVPVIATKLDLRGTLVGERYSQLPTPVSPKQAELKTDAYFLLGARVSRVFCQHYEIYCAVDNLLDKNYAPEVDLPGPGRTLWLGITTKF